MSEKEGFGTKALKILAPVAAVGGGIALLLYFIYKYMNAGLESAQDDVRYWMNEIISESKEWFKTNQQQGISGLTSAQENILKLKEGFLEEAQQRLEKEYAARNLISVEMVTGLIIGVFTVVFLALAPRIIQEFKTRVFNKPVTSGERQGSVLSPGVANICLHAVAWDFALQGDVGLASSIQTAISSMYTTHFLPGLEQNLANYSQQLTILLPGTIEYIAISTLMNYTQTAIATNALLAINSALMLPPIFLGRNA